MVRMMSSILSLVLLVVGFLGITGLFSVFTLHPILANLGAMMLGILGLVVVIYVRRGQGPSDERKENAQLRDDIHDQQQRESERLKAEISQLKKENELLRSKYEQSTL